MNSLNVITPVRIRSSSVGLTFDGLFVTGITSDGLASLSDSVNDATTFEWDAAMKLVRSSSRYAVVVLPLCWVSSKKNAPQQLV